MSLLLALLAAILPICATEDSSNCHWGALEQGNGIGHSFIDLNGKVIYVD